MPTVSSLVSGIVTSCRGRVVSLSGASSLQRCTRHCEPTEGVVGEGVGRIGCGSNSGVHGSDEVLY